MAGLRGSLKGYKNTMTAWVNATDFISIASAPKHHPPLSWNEIKSKAQGFSKTWANAANEDSQVKPFWIDFFEIFGISDKRVATFERSTE
jgi:hypothetical protein